MKTTLPKHIAHNLTPDDKRRISFEICDRIVRGELLFNIAREEGMPHRDTFANWCKADPEIAAAYAASQDDRIDFLMHELLSICDEEIPTYKDARGNIRMDPAAAGRMRVRVNTRRWLITLLAAHRDKTSRSTQTAAATTSPQRTPPAQRPRPSTGHPLDNPQAPALPATPSPLFRQSRPAKLPFPMSKTGFQLYAAFKDGELDAQRTPVPLTGPIASAIPTPTLYAEKVPILSVE